MINAPRFGGPRGAPSSHQVLFDGTFDGREARDIVRSLSDASANAYKLRNLRNQVRSERPDQGAMRRLDKLQSAQSELLELIAAGAGRLRVQLRAGDDVDAELEVDLELLPSAPSRLGARSSTRSSTRSGMGPG